MVVFDGMCIEKPSAFHAKPSKEISDDTEEEYMSASPNSTKGKPSLIKKWYLSGLTQN